MTGQEIQDDLKYGRGSALFGGSMARTAAEEISDALGESFFVHSSLSDPSRKSDQVLTVDRVGTLFSLDLGLLSYYSDFSSSLWDDHVYFGFRSAYGFFRSGERIAVWEEAAEAVEVSASTPEPNLILGFITLGGLMLGSKRKTKS
ncbi:MAG: PEP-CTERM sorting domain-containing protein [Okeania sp. SIO2D1]|nr:PEP-CTERM sorting domain-containing protein [Okeania sp. SIO2D1]